MKKVLCLFFILACGLNSTQAFSMYNGKTGDNQLHLTERGFNLLYNVLAIFWGMSASNVQETPLDEVVVNQDAQEDGEEDRRIRTPNAVPFGVVNTFLTHDLWAHIFGFLDRQYYSYLALVSRAALNGFYLRIPLMEFEALSLQSSISLMSDPATFAINPQAGSFLCLYNKLRFHCARRLAYGKEPKLVSKIRAQIVRLLEEQDEAGYPSLIRLLAENEHSRALRILLYQTAYFSDLFEIPQPNGKTNLGSGEEYLPMLYEKMLKAGHYTAFKNLCKMLNDSCYFTPKLNFVKVNICKKDFEEVRELIKILVKMEYRFGEDKWSLLHMAAETHDILNSCEIGTRYILSLEEDPNVTNIYGWTPLHSAARRGFLDGIRVLVNEGKANIDALTITGDTALILAARGGHAEAFDLLLELGAEYSKKAADLLELQKKLREQEVAAYLKLELEWKKIRELQNARRNDEGEIEDIFSSDESEESFEDDESSENDA